MLSFPTALIVVIFLLPSIEMKILIPAKTNPATAADKEIVSEQIIDNFHIGFDLDYNNITNELLKKYQLKDLIEAGITKETNNDYIDIFSNRIKSIAFFRHVKCKTIISCFFFINYIIIF